MTAFDDSMSMIQWPCFCHPNRMSTGPPLFHPVGVNDDGMAASNQGFALAW